MPALRPIALHRRTRDEQMLVRLIRASEQQIDDAVLSAACAQLRNAAIASDLRIERPTTPFVSDDERRLIAWIALYQRVAIRPLEVPPNQSLRDAARNCAIRLDAMGIKLPSLSLAALSISLPVGENLPIEL